MPDVLFEIRDQIAHLTLNRPDKLNAFNRSMSLELQDHLLACDEDDSVRAVLLTGSGRAFCSGQDLSEFPTDRLPDFEKVIDEYYNPGDPFIKNHPETGALCRKWYRRRSRCQFRIGL